MKKLNLKSKNIYIFILLIIMTFSTSIGYAYYQENLKINGNVALLNINGIEIIELTELENNNVSTSNMEYSHTLSENKSIAKSNVSSIFTGNNSYVIYNYKLKNNSNEIYTYENLDNIVSFSSASKTIELNQPRLLNLEHGDVLNPGEEREVQLIYYYESDLGNESYLLNASISFNFTIGTVNAEEIKTSINKDYYEMDSSNYAYFDVTILNLKETSIKYNLILSNENTILVDENDEEIEISDILNSGESQDYNLKIKVINQEEGYESIETNLFLETEEKKRILISTLTLYEEEERPTIKRAEVTWTIEPAADGAWEDHYTVIFSVNNLCDYTVEEWTISLKFKDTMNIIEIQNWNDVWEFNEETNTLNVSSKKRYQDGDHSIEVKNSYVSDQFIFYMTNSELEVEEIEVYKDGIIYDMGG